jgi:hypothetical protein
MSQEQLEELMDQAEELQASPAKVAILEQAVKLSDALGDLEQSYAIRQDLIEAAVFGGMDDRALVAFAWCISQSDQDPERFPESDLLWRYKWILGSITSFPNVSTQRIQQMEDDYQERLKRSGHGLKAVYKIRMLNASYMGLIERRDHFEDKWRKAPHDEMADCKACEIDSEVKYLNSKGDYQAAIKSFLPSCLWGIWTKPVKPSRKVIAKFLAIPITSARSAGILATSYEPWTFLEAQDLSKGICLGFSKRTISNNKCGSTRTPVIFLSGLQARNRIRGEFEFQSLCRSIAPRIATNQPSLLSGSKAKRLKLPSDLMFVTETILLARA